MKKFAATAMFLLLLCWGQKAFALNDREYYDMRKDPFFRAVDKRLTKFFEELKTLIPDKDFASLSQTQKQWLAVSRDLEAEEFIRKNNIAKADAYVKATEGRIKYLESIRRKYVNEPEPESKPESEKVIAESEQETQTQPKSESAVKPVRRQKTLTQIEARELLKLELRRRGLWYNNHVLITDDEDKDDGRFTLYDEENDTQEDCWHFVQGEDHPDYVSAINDYYVGMNSGAIYVLDTFYDVVRPIDEADL